MRKHFLMSSIEVREAMGSPVRNELALVHLTASIKGRVNQFLSFRLLSNFTRERMKKVNIFLNVLLIGFVRENCGAPTHVGFVMIGNYCKSKKRSEKLVD